MWELTILNLADTSFDVVQSQVADLILEGIEIHDGRMEN
jgi:hypothetical protein